MAIRHWVQTTAFGPEDIARLVEAYEQVLANLGMTDRSDPATELIAKTIIGLAQNGETDPARLSAMTLAMLNPRP
jgi:hypothetical protein